MNTGGQRLYDSGGMPRFVMDIGLPANKSKADIRSNIKAFTSCATFANTVVGPGAGGPVLIEA